MHFPLHCSKTCNRLGPLALETDPEQFLLPRFTEFALKQISERKIKNSAFFLLSFDLMKGMFTFVFFLVQTKSFEKTC